MSESATDDSSESIAEGVVGILSFVIVLVGVSVGLAGTASGRLPLSIIGAVVFTLGWFGLWATWLGGGEEGGEE